MPRILRQEVGPTIRVTLISPGFTATRFAEHVKNPEVKAQLEAAGKRLAMSPDAIGRAIVYAIEQPSKVDVGEIVIRSSAQA